jgi:formamidopyrimidine-DNA glycosylase
VQAKIHPEQPATILSSDDCKHLRAAIHEVVEKAVAVDADSECFPENWIFHQRWHRKPGKLDGNQIETIAVNGRTSAYVPALQKYSGPPLKSLRKKASSKDEADDEDEEAKVKSRKRVPEKRASAKDGRDDEEAQGNVQKRISRKGVSPKKEPEVKVNETSENSQKRDSRRRASSKPQEPEDEDEDSRKQSASKEDPEDRDNGPKANTQKRASGNRAVSKEGPEDEDKEEGKTKKRGRHNPTTAAAQDKGSSAVTFGNAESKHGKGRPPKSINGNVSKATDVKLLTEVSTTRSLGSLGKVAKVAEEGRTTRASRRVDVTHGKTMTKLEAK